MTTDKGRTRTIVIAAVVAALAAAGAAALLVNILERKQEARNPFYRVEPLTEDTVDPAVWGRNFPHQYDSYRRTVDQVRTRYGGSEAVPRTPTQADPRSVVAQPYDPQLLATIEKAIRSSDLGLNPASDGKVVRVPIPPLTDERRRELSRHVHKLAEEGRNALRQVRREANDRLKKMLKDHAISEDDERRALDEVQKITDGYIKAVDDLQKRKDTELLGH